MTLFMAHCPRPGRTGYLARRAITNAGPRPRPTQPPGKFTPYPMKLLKKLVEKLSDARWLSSAVCAP